LRCCRPRSVADRLCLAGAFATVEALIGERFESRCIRDERGLGEERVRQVTRANGGVEQLPHAFGNEWDGLADRRATSAFWNIL
jgi:hypothetical protein